MISFIICSIDDKRFNHVEPHIHQVMGTEIHEIVRIKDAKSMCEGYNRGIAQSKGELLVFCHDDIEFLVPDAARRITDALAHFDIIGVAGTNRLETAQWIAAGPGHIFGVVAHPGQQPGKFTLSIFGAPRRAVTGIQALDGLFIACRREVAETIGWDADTYRSFHLYDLDWTFRAHQAGYRLAVLLDLPIFHRSGGNFNTPEWKTAADAFMKKHQGALAQARGRKFGFAGAAVSSRPEILSVISALCESIDDQPL